MESFLYQASIYLAAAVIAVLLVAVLLVAVLLAARPATGTKLLLARLLFGGHFALRLAQHAGVMFGVLQEILSRDAIIRQLGIARQHLIFLDDLLRRATHLALGPRAFKHPVDDIAERARAVLLGTRTGLGRAHVVL